MGERGGSRGAPERARRSGASGSAGQTAVPGGEHRKEGASLNGVTTWTLFFKVSFKWANALEFHLA